MNEFTPLDPETFLKPGKWEIVYQETATPQLFRKEIFRLIRSTKVKELMAPGFNIVFANEV